jgi:hypothetical protein
MKRLLFCPDDEADPLWDQDGANVSLDYLPLRVDTRRAVRSWCRGWARLVDRWIWDQAVRDGMSDRPVEPVSPEEWDDSEREARQLFERMKGELGPDWSVEWALETPG